MNRLQEEYINQVELLKSSLERTEKRISFDESRQKNIGNLIRKYQKMLFKDLDQSINEFERIALKFTKEEHEVHKRYFQSAIHPLALRSPFNKRCFDKPLGYSGDYLVMEMIYSDPYQGDSVFAKLMNYHSITLPIVQAVISRNDYIKKKIRATTKNNPGASIFNVGAGPAREIREVFKGLNGNSSKIYLIDQEKEAIEFVKHHLDGSAGSVTFINNGVKSLLKKSLNEKFDLIYSMGLFDYLPDRFAKLLIESLFGMLNEGGKLIIANARYNPCRIWMEHGVEWYLIYRSKKELLDLAAGLNPAPLNVYSEGQNSSRIFMFLIIER